MNLLMYSGILSGIVLALVGIIKSPFIKFKEKKFYKPFFTALTIVLVVASCVVCELFIIEGQLFSLGMAYLTFMTLGGTMVTYNGIYEGFKVKELFKKLFALIKKLFTKTPEAKLTKQANKIGITNAIDLLNNLLNTQETKKEVVKEVKTEEPKQEVKIENVVAQDRNIIRGV